MQEGLDEQLLEAQRGGPRCFRRLDAVATYLRSLGCSTFEVEFGHWEPQALKLQNSQGRRALNPD